MADKFDFLIKARKLIRYRGFDKKVVIPEGVISIEEDAFKNLDFIEDITIPCSIEAISFDAFYGCRNLKAIIVHNITCWCKAIFTKEWESRDRYPSYSLFVDNQEVKELFIPNNINRINDYTFVNCKSLEKVYIPTDIEYIGYHAFQNCKSLSYVEMSNNIIEVDNDAFEGCNLKYNSYDNGIYLGSSTNPYTLLLKAKSKDIKEILVAPDCKSIAAKAFYKCDNLKKITFQHQMASISPNATGEGKALQSIDVREPYTNAEDITFNAHIYDALLNITSIVVPKNVKQIDLGVFYDNENLEDISITKNGIDYFEAFNELHCASYKKIKYNEYEHGLYIGDKDNPYLYLLRVTSKNITSLKIHEDCIGISYACNECKKLKKVTMPKGLKVIGEESFAHCESLETIEIPKSVERIGNDAFFCCKSLKSIFIHSSVKSIGTDAFFGSDSLDIVVDNLDFWRDLEKTNCGAKYYLYENDKLVTDIVVPGSIYKIKPYAFAGCRSLKNVIIQEGVSSIGNSAFSECINIENVIIPNSVSTIERYAFYRCSQIEKVVIPNSVSKVGNSAFYKCTSLKAVEMSDNVKVIEEGTFCECSSLTTINMPKNLVCVEEQAFHSCKSLTSLSFPKTCKKIEKEAFYDCSSLTNVEMEKRIERISASAFYCCYKLKKTWF